MNRIKSLLNGKKVSVLFNEYASPVLEFYLEEAGYAGVTEMSIEEMNRVLQLPWLIWNAVVAQGSKENKIDYLGSITLLTKHTPNEIKELIKYMRDRKETKFKEYDFFLGEFKLSRSNISNEITLTVEARGGS
jgi:hypothetical protein